MRTRVTVVTLSVCVSMSVVTLMPAYDVCATNRTYRSGLCWTPKVFNRQISLKRFRSRGRARSLFRIVKWAAICNWQY